MMKLNFALVFAVLLAACQGPVASVSSGHSLTVSWAPSGARTIVPASYPAPATYDVVLTPTSGSPVSQLGLTATSWVFLSLPPSIYTITVTGKDIGGNPLVSGTGSADMTSSASQSPTIPLTYFTSGAGTGQIHLTFDCTGLGVTSTSLTLVDPSGATIVNDAPLTGSSPIFTYSNASATVGSYKVYAKFINGTTNLGAFKLDTVLVAQNVDTAATVAVLPGDMQAQTFRLFALEMRGLLWSSSDMGTTWASRAFPATWQELAGSGDGMTLVAAAGGYNTPSSIYRSTDGGLNWTATPAPAHNYNGLGSSDDGTILGAAVYDGSNTFYYSVDSGTTWASTTIGAGYWWSTPMASADGKRWIFCNGGDGASNVYVWQGTFDGNVTWNWTQTPYGHDNSGFANPVGYAISKDGTKLLAAFPTVIHLSPDFGTTWNSVPLPPAAVALGLCLAALSGDGNTIMVAGVNGSVYTTKDAGTTWTTASLPAFVPLGGTVTTAENIRFAALSYDGSKIAFSTVYGSNILPLTGGYLYTSIDGGATFTKSVAGGNRFWWGLTIQSK